MAAVLSFRPRVLPKAGGTQTFAQPRARDASGKVISLQQERRPFTPRDIELLRLVFSDLEGYCGLGSNFGHMIEQLEAQVVVIDGAPGNVNQLDGLMHVHATEPSKRLLDTPVESYCCWANKKAALVGRARASLQRLGLMDAVVLARMYGQDERNDAPIDISAKRGADEADVEVDKRASPPHVWQDDFKMLADQEGYDNLANIATLTMTVTKHAERMTQEARQSRHYDFFVRGLETRGLLDVRRFGGHVTSEDMRRHAGESRLEISPLEALSDLLVVHSGDTRERRSIKKLAAETIRREANGLLRSAQTSFLMEMRKPWVEKGWRAPKASWLAPVDYSRRVVGYRDGRSLLSCGHYTEETGHSMQRCRECAER